MKIDFNEKGMTINFDKVPKLLYFNEESCGCGAVFLNGQRIKGLMELKVHSETADEHSGHPLKYFIKHFDKENHDIKTIESEEGNDE